MFLHLGGVDDEVSPEGVSCLGLVNAVEPRDVAILVLHERELDAKDAAIARVQIGKTLVHHHTVLGHSQQPGVRVRGVQDHAGDEVDDVPAVERLQLRSTRLQLQQLTWGHVAKVKGVEEEDKPLASVVVDADVHELVLLEANGGEPGSLVSRKDGHHVCSL